MSLRIVLFFKGCCSIVKSGNGSVHRRSFLFDVCGFNDHLASTFPGLSIVGIVETAICTSERNDFLTKKILKKRILKSVGQFLSVWLDKTFFFEQILE